MKVLLIAAVSADGFIAEHAEQLTDWTTPEDKKLFVEVTKQAGVIVFGSRTFETIGRALPDRRNIVYTTRPDAINTEGVETTQEEPTKLISRLEKEGEHGLAVCGGAAIYDLFMQAGVVNELYITIEPRLFGKGITLFTSAMNVKLELLEVRQLNSNSVLLRYNVAG